MSRITDPPELTRRGFVLGAFASAALVSLAGCGDDGSSAAADGPWEYTDDRGVVVRLPQRPQRIAAYVGTAAVLWDFGVKSSVVFGPQRRQDGTAEPTAGNVDLDAVESAGDTWDGVNLERLAALAPDIVISGGVDSPWVISEQLDDVGKIAPVIVVEVYGAPAPTIIANYERLAVALGADLESAELTKAKEAFGAAGDELAAAAADKPGLSVLVTYADVDGLYIAKAKDFPDLLAFQERGVTIVEPGGEDDYWELLSWEEADRYPADVIIHDVRSFSLQPDVLAADQPTWSALPAVEAEQVGAWSAETVLSYQGFTVAFAELAATIRASRADVV